MLGIERFLEERPVAVPLGVHEQEDLPDDPLLVGGAVPAGGRGQLRYQFWNRKFCSGFWGLAKKVNRMKSFRLQEKEAPAFKELLSRHFFAYKSWRRWLSTSELVLEQEHCVQVCGDLDKGELNKI